MEEKPNSGDPKTAFMCCLFYDARQLTVKQAGAVDQELFCGKGKVRGGNDNDQTMTIRKMLASGRQKKEERYVDFVFLGVLFPVASLLLFFTVNGCFSNGG